MMHGDYLNKAKVTIVKFQNIMGLPFGGPIISLYLRILFALRLKISIWQKINGNGKNRVRHGGVSAHTTSR